MKKILNRPDIIDFFHRLTKNYLYERECVEVEEAILPIFLNQTTESVDVGANYGRYTVLMSLFSQHVHSFEPSPQCIKYLENLCLPNVSIYPRALSSNEGFDQYFAPIKEGTPFSSHGSLEQSVLTAYRDVDTIKVAKSTLDSLSAKRISFVKIDVEGHEMEVLSGGQNLISEQQPIFMVEVEERHKPGNVVKIKDFFDKFNYQGFYISEGSIFPFASFVDELQNPQELKRPVPRKEMRYVNNFIFIPPSIETDSVIKKMSAKLSNPFSNFNFTQIFVLFRVAMGKSRNHPMN